MAKSKRIISSIVVQDFPYRRRQGQHANAFVNFCYTYNKCNIVEYLNSIDGQTSYDYDYLGQLIGADYAGQSDESYVYDENGNRITANGDIYTTGVNNELTSDGDYTYTYDAEGNRISKSNSTDRELYEWDYRNRLTQVIQQTFNAETQTWETVQIVEYSYDYNNVWIRKVIGNSKTIFIPENYQTTVQIDNGTVSHHYLWTPQTQDKLLADTTSTDVLWSLTDHLGTIRDILAATSTHLIYDAFGNLISGTNPLLFGYTGKAFDVSTNLQNNINRWYDATVGRWLSTDPIGFEGNDTNLYRYMGNNLNYTDPWGLKTKNKEIKITGNCKIVIFIGHGISDPDVPGGFGHFVKEFDIPNPDILNGDGIWLGTVGCFSEENNYQNSPIMEYQRIPGISNVSGVVYPRPNWKMGKYDSLLAKEMETTISGIKDLAETLCANRECFNDDGNYENYQLGTSFRRCDTITVKMIMYNKKQKKFVDIKHITLRCIDGKIKNQRAFRALELDYSTMFETLDTN